MWQGIPFLPGQERVLSYGYMAIEHLPKINIDTSFGWDTFGSSIVASLITGTIAWFAINKNADISLQDRKSQIIAANRQLWINDVRNCSAEIISKIHTLLIVVDTIIAHYPAAQPALEEQVSKLKSEINFLSAKMNLLLNPDEDNSKKAIGCIQALIMRTTFYDATGNFRWKLEINEKTQLFTEAIQSILLTEWRRVKENE